MKTVEVKFTGSDTRFDWVQSLPVQFTKFEVSAHHLSSLCLHVLNCMMKITTLICLTGFGGQMAYYYMECSEQSLGWCGGKCYMNEADCVSTDGHSKVSSMCPSAVASHHSSIKRKTLNLGFPCILLWPIECGRRELCVIFFWFHLSYLFTKILLLFNNNCMPFLPIPPPHPSWTHLPPTSTLPLDFVHVSFIVVPVIPSHNIKLCCKML